jgi:hypothetical protein
MKWFLLGLLMAALGFFGYQWVVTHYVILSNEDMLLLMMAVLETYCQ